MYYPASTFRSWNNLCISIWQWYLFSLRALFLLALSFQKISQHSGWRGSTIWRGSVWFGGSGVGLRLRLGSAVAAQFYLF